MNIAENNICYSSAQNKMSYLPNYYKWISDKSARYLSGEIWDIGCGSGHIVDQYMHNKNIKRITAVDQDSDCIDDLKKRYAECENNNKLNVVHSDIISFLDQQRNGVADNVIMLDVLEHFDDDTDVLKKVNDFLSPQGKLVIKVPAGADLYCEIDRQSGHYRRYDYTQLKQLMVESGFSVLSLSYMNPLGRAVYRFKSKKETKTNFSKSFSVNFLKTINIAMNVLPLFDVLGLPGLSLIGIFKKNEEQP